MRNHTNLSFNEQLSKETGTIILSDDNECIVYTDGDKAQKILRITRDGSYIINRLVPVMFDIEDLKDYLIRKLWKD